MTPDTKPNASAACPLSPALVLLLQSCLDARSTCDKELAGHLRLSPQTVHTEFKLIAERLDTHCRFEAVLIALEKGWIRLAFSPPPLKISLRNVDNMTHKITPKRGIARIARFLL